jgi:catechol 2,3-dioxygenase-like lactoylglutathione lyase family enzyme
MPRVRRVLETAVYCDDLAKTVEFYKAVLALDPMLAAERVVAFDAGEGTVLLLFQRGASDLPFETPGGLVPGHVSTGPAHFAFAVDTEDVSGWLDRLNALRIPIESRVDWPRGGHSIYFRDPDGRSVELATPGVWPSY